MKQIKGTLQMMQEDMQTLGKMNQVLFNSWQDQMSEKFANECVGEMTRKWKECVQTMESLISQLCDAEKDIENLHERSRRR